VANINVTLHYARLDRDSGRIFGTARVSTAGAALSGITPTTFSLFDPVNKHGQIAFLASDGTNAGAFRHQATLFTKY
jgi:hypothetical protein